MTTVLTPVVVELDRATWNGLYAKRISELTGMTHKESLKVADAADDAFNDGDEPVMAADDELSYWGD